MSRYQTSLTGTTAVTMNLELDPEEERALVAELRRVIADDRYPFSKRIRLPPPKVYAPPRARPGQRRGRR